MLGRRRDLQEYETRRGRWFPSSLVVSPPLPLSTHFPLTRGPYRNVILCYIVWLSATRTAKLLPHLWWRPQDIIYVPAFIAFGYYFAVMKLYALFTLHEVRSPRFYLAYLSMFTDGRVACRLVGEPVRASATPRRRRRRWTTAMTRHRQTRS